MGKDKDSDPIGEGYVVGFSCVCNLHFLNWVVVNSVYSSLYNFVQMGSMS